MTRSALTISFWVIYVWLCRDGTDFFSAYFSGKAIYVWLCRDFDFHIGQLSAENRPTFRRIQTGLLCRARSNIFIKVWMRSGPSAEISSRFPVLSLNLIKSLKQEPYLVILLRVLIWYTPGYSPFVLCLVSDFYSNVLLAAPVLPWIIKYFCHVWISLFECLWFVQTSNM